jgi:hypothetical protein
LRRSEMRLGKLTSSASLLCVLMFAASAYARGDWPDADAYRAERTREIGALIAQPTPNNLAAAALLAVPGELGGRQALELMARSEALAPQRAELAWAYLAVCKHFKCEAEEQIVAHLQAIDPDNGFMWIANLEYAELSGSPGDVTAAIVRIGAGPRMSFYWNQLEVMMADALAMANPSQTPHTRGISATGLLVGEVIPPLQAISKACRLEQLDLPGRRPACEALVSRMERSSTVLTQSLAISMQERWWPAGSPQRDVIRGKRRRLDYLMTISGRIRWWRLNRDMALRLDAARNTDREEDVELAMVKSLGLPPEPPVGWKDTLHPG